MLAHRPSPPTNLAANLQNSATGRLRVTYYRGNTSYSNRFTLYRSNTRNGAYSNAGVTSVIDSSSPVYLDPPGEGWYKVKGQACRTASTSTGCGSLGAFSNAQYWAGPPAAPPTNLRLSRDTYDNDELDVTYTRSSGSTHNYQFELHRSDTENGNYTRNRVTTDSVSPATFEDLDSGYWYRSRAKNCRTSSGTGCGNWSLWSNKVEIPDALTSPTNMRLAVQSSDRNRVDLTFTRTSNPEYHELQLHKARVAGEFTYSSGTSVYTGNSWNFSAPQGYWYRARGKACNRVGGVSDCSAWSAWSNILSPPITPFNFSPNPVTAGMSSDIWTVPSGVSSVYLDVEISDGTRISSGGVRVQRVTSTGALWNPATTYDAARDDDSGRIPNARTGWMIRVDADPVLFDRDRPQATLDFHSGSDATGPRIATAFVQAQGWPSVPVSGTAVVNTAADSVTLGWRAGTLRTGALPDHFEVVIPNPSNPSTPLYRNRNVDDSANPASLVIANASATLGAGTHTAQVRHCNAVGGCAGALNITFTVNSSSAAVFQFTPRPLGLWGAAATFGPCPPASPASTWT